ncbi:hypothetical protein BJ508DRAFT_310275 [Ascobolus immersus RN42]|uniref:Uncharacterized protein n=1 Tax=Ascobolus immersus RN42 TaxID=1160509 RepID=A0A3N4I665_ASCIM|nr:hypothetical protein BJ508DRAFT_310275 [Ascobolus immersus RN42]
MSSGYGCCVLKNFRLVPSIKYQVQVAELLAHTGTLALAVSHDHKGRQPSTGTQIDYPMPKHSHLRNVPLLETVSDTSSLENVTSTTKQQPCLVEATPPHTPSTIHQFADMDPTAVDTQDKGLVRKSMEENRPKRQLQKTYNGSVHSTPKQNPRLVVKRNKERKRDDTDRIMRNVDVDGTGEEGAGENAALERESLHCRLEGCARKGKPLASKGNLVQHQRVCGRPNKRRRAIRDDLVKVLEFPYQEHHKSDQTHHHPDAEESTSMRKSPEAADEKHSQQDHHSAPSRHVSAHEFTTVIDPALQAHAAADSDGPRKGKKRIGVSAPLQRLPQPHDNLQQKKSRRYQHRFINYVVGPEGENPNALPPSRAILQELSPQSVQASNQSPAFELKRNKLVDTPVLSNRKFLFEVQSADVLRNSSPSTLNLQARQETRMPPRFYTLQSAQPRSFRLLPPAPYGCQRHITEPSEIVPVGSSLLDHMTRASQSPGGLVPFPPCKKVRKVVDPRELLRSGKKWYE